MTDINTLLANAEHVFANQAALARASAARALEDWVDPILRDRGYETRMRQESERLSAVAATWQARAAEARRGYLLFSAAEVEDTDFLFTYRVLIEKCRAAGRIVYERQIDRALDSTPRC